jgi:ubiquinone/menaquinone biosynthesis C-methylase UbiE
MMPWAFWTITTVGSLRRILKLPPRSGEVKGEDIVATKTMIEKVETTGSSSGGKVVNKPMNNLSFKGMSLLLKLRDMLIPRDKVLDEVGIKQGSYVLDYGCGPGRYILPAWKLVGESGKIYALDIHPLGVRKVKELASSKGLTNVEAILSDCSTGLPDASIDVAFLYDIFHMLGDPDGVLRELHRALKQEGTLSFSDHHMKEDEIIKDVTAGGLFRLEKKGRKTYSFMKS